MEEGKAIPIGTKVTINNKPEFGVGVVKYVGMTKFQTGRWVGIELSKPIGKNDGTVQGEKYFDCKPAHGIFVKPNVVIVQELPAEQQTLESESPVVAVATPAAPVAATKEVDDDAKLMPPPPAAAALSSSGSGMRSPAPSGMRPPSSTGMRPPSSGGTGTVAATTTPAAATETPKAAVETPEVVKKTPTKTADDTTTTTTTTTTTPGLKKPASTTATKEPATGLKRPSVSGVKSTDATATTKSGISRTSIAPKSTTTTTTSAAAEDKTKAAEPVKKVEEKKEPTPVAAPPTPVTPSVVEEKKPDPVVAAPPPVAAPTVEEKVATPPKSTTPSPPISSPSVEKKVQKIVQGEDDDEEEDSDDDIKEMLKTSSPQVATPQMNENVEKMMNAINELNEYKSRSQDQIVDLQNSIKEVTMAREKAAKEYEKQIQQLEKAMKEKEKETEHTLKSQAKHDESIEKQLARATAEWEKERAVLNEQIETLSEGMEMLTLDKEFAEEKAECAEMELETAKEELELLKSRIEAQELERDHPFDGPEGEAGGESAAVLRAQNEKLKETLVKLRDIALNEKHELSKKSKDLEASTKQVSGLLDKVARLDGELATRTNEVEELKAALDDAATSEELVGALSEKNMELSEELAELKTAIADLEDMRDLAAELEENQAAVEKQLRSEMRGREIECLGLNGALANAQLKLQENDRTILQFRSLVSRLQSQLEEARRAGEKHAEQNSLWGMIQQELLSKNIQLQHQVTKATAMEIDHQLEKYRAKEAELHLSFVSEFLPEQSFQADNDAIRLLLILKRIVLKSELAQRYLNKTYRVEEIGAAAVPSDAGDQVLTASEVGHSLQIIHLLDHLSISATWLQESLQQCTVEHWLRAGRSVKDIEHQEKVLDHLLELIKQERYGASYASTDLDRMTTKIDAIIINVFGDKIYKSEWSILLNHVLNIQYAIKQIMLNDRNICELAPSACEGRTYYFPQTTLSKALSVCRKVVKNLTCQPLLRNSSIVHDVLIASEAMCKSLLTILASGAPRVAEDPANFTSVIAGIDMRAEQLAADASSSSDGFDDDSIEAEDTASMSALERVFARMASQLKDVVETILAGDLELSAAEKSEILSAMHPWVSRASILKASLGEAGTLRDAIAAKESEALENLKMMRVRDADLMEEKRKEEALDKRIKTLAKNEQDLTEALARETASRSENETTYKQAIGRLQKDKQVLEQELKGLQTRYVSLERESSKKTVAVPLVEARVDNIETACLRKAIRHLRGENVRLKSQKSVSELASLVGSAPSRLMTRSNVSTDEDIPATTTNKAVKFSDILDYSNQVDTCMGELLETMVTPKVIDLLASKTSSASSSNIGGDSPTMRQLLKQKQHKIRQLEFKMTQLVQSSISAPSLAPLPFGKFGDIASSRVRKEIKPQLVGSITLPTFGNSSTASSSSSSLSSLLLDADIQKALSSNTTTLPRPIQIDGIRSLKELHSEKSCGLQIEERSPSRHQPLWRTELTTNELTINYQIFENNAHHLHHLCLCLSRPLFIRARHITSPTAPTKHSHNPCSTAVSGHKKELNRGWILDSPTGANRSSHMDNDTTHLPSASMPAGVSDHPTTTTTTTSTSINNNSPPRQNTSAQSMNSNNDSSGSLRGKSFSGTSPNAKSPGNKSPTLTPNKKGSSLRSNKPKKSAKPLKKQKKRYQGNSRNIYVNDPARNSNCKFVGNKIQTTKYSIITFIPKNLYEQFRRVANFYFLVIAIIQLIPGISPVNPYTTWVPLLFVLSVTAIKEGVEDWKRRQSDNKINNLKAKVLRGQEFVNIPWKMVSVGDIVKVVKGERFPADLVLLNSSEQHGVCYIETSNLDGETNLKQRQALPQTYENLRTEEDLALFRGFIECEHPNNVIYVYHGAVALGSDPTDPKYPLNSTQTLLRGCILRNTDWIYGTVVYTGEDTKIMQNSTDAPSKRSTLEKLVNRALINLFAVMFVVCLVSTIVNVAWTSKHITDTWYLGFESKATRQSALNFLTFMITFAVMIPISLYVSLELVKVAQAVFIYWDRDMYHAESDTPARSRTSNLSEELGQIEYIFSDKTGTLTRNQMDFLKCSVGKMVYGSIESTQSSDNVEFQKLSHSVMEGIPGADPNFGFRDRRIIDHLDEDSEQSHLINEFLTLLAVCHTVIPDRPNKDDSVIEYEASSPDEAALVTAAKNLGYMFYSREPTCINVNVRGKIERFEFLNILEFNSDRKRMSMIVRNPQGRIVIYTKGADTTVLPLLRRDQDDLHTITLEFLQDFAADGLRTLCLAYAFIEEEDYIKWNESYKEAAVAINDREEKLDRVAEFIERDLILLGSTAIEDKLQIGVPEAIANLAKANIKIWVLTGDKQETAINIGFSCHLLTSDMKIIILNGKTPEDVEEQIRGALEAYFSDNVVDFPHTGFALVVEGSCLSFALEGSLKDQFLQLASNCRSVICCRTTPLQKAQVVKVVRDTLRAVTLAIGDGANDVSMIQAAHIGVGISGNEGMQAVMASDYSIAQFRFLYKLLVVHGRWDYKRNSRLMLYCFYKNMVFAMTQFWFGVYNAFSAQTIFDSFSISVFNVIFTGLPILIYAIMDQDVSPSSSMKYPQLYKSGQKDSEFNLKILWIWLSEAWVHSVVIFFGVFGFYRTGATLLGDGQTLDIWAMGQTIFVLVVITVNLKLALETRYWTWLTHFSIWGSIIIWFIWQGILSAIPTAGGSSTGEVYSIAYHLFKSPIFWLSLFVIPVICLIPDSMYKILQRDFRPYPFQIVQEIEKIEGKPDPMIFAERGVTQAPAGSIEEFTVADNGGGKKKRTRIPFFTFFKSTKVNKKNTGYAFSHPGQNLGSDGNAQHL
eukprot:gene11475-13378_t